MNSQTVKMLMMFFLATALLNITNYLFYILYNPPSHHALKFEELRTKFTTKRHFIHTVRWSALLLSKDAHNASPSSAGDILNKDDSNQSPSSADVKSVVQEDDYRDQSSDINRFYYYNGIRKGPVICPLKPLGLGPVNIDETLTLETIEKLYDVLELGGIHQVSECAARQSVAIIIPYSGMKTQLLRFLYILNPILIKQQLDYQVFVIHSNQSLPLNRGKLLNAGFTEAQRMKQNGGWRCIIFHEMDLLPTDSRNLYRCSKNPHQLVTSIGNRSYEYQFGGAIAIDPAQFSKVNGFSNLYTGNEAVYDYLYKRFQTIQTSSPLNLNDGLSTLSYTLNNIEQKQMYTFIDVDLEISKLSLGNVTEKIWNRLLNEATMTTYSSTKTNAKNLNA